MKKTSYIKKALLQVTFVSSILLIVSCNNSQKPKEVNVVVEESNIEKPDDNKQGKDVAFLIKASELNLEGIHLGQLALQKGSIAHVKDLGKMMVDAHTKSQMDLIVLADNKMMIIPNSPTDKTKDAYTRLNNKSGNDFDKSFADMMVSEHENAIDIFEKAAIDGIDSEIKKWTVNTLPELRKHLNHSIECQKKCNKM